MDVKDHKSIKLEKYGEENRELDFEEVIDDEEEDCEELQLPRPTSWIDPGTGNIVRGMEVFSLKYELHGRPNSTHTRPGDDEFDVCPICYHLWTTNGTHRLCCLPCGHMYGLSCIETWLQSGNSRKCPQCKTFCTLKDVNLLYATRLRIPDATAAAHQIFVDQKASNRYFPYSSAGVNAYRDYELGRLLYASKERSEVLKRRAAVLGQQNVVLERWTELLNLKARAEKRDNALEQRADALRLRANALGRWADEYLRKADALGRRAEAYHRMDKGLMQRLEALDTSILIFRQCLKKHRWLARKKKSERRDAAVVSNDNVMHQDYDKLVST